MVNGVYTGGSYPTVDQRRVEELSPADAALIDGMRAAVQGPAALQMGEEEELPCMSTLSEEGVMAGLGNHFINHVLDTRTLISMAFYVVAGIVCLL